MKPPIQFIGAGAGSGKTTAVVNTIVAALLDGSCVPAGLIATTYTVKAAQELRERIRRALLEGGHAALAEQLDLALIGTVHSVCARLLRRFAFEAGISPAVEVLARVDTICVDKTGTLTEPGMRVRPCMCRMCRLIRRCPTMPRRPWPAGWTASW